MRGMVLAMGVAVLAVPAVAQEGPIRDVISRQIEAMRADDFGTAFTFASPVIKRKFQTPENFGAMVRGGYPMVWRPEDLRFLELREVAGALWQKLLIRDDKGGIHILDYQMIETPDGWQINGVQILAKPEVAA